MYLSGATIGDMEEHFGCSDSPILRILDNAGIERRRGRPTGHGSAPRTPAERKPQTISVVYEPVGRPPVTVHGADEPETGRSDGRSSTKLRVPSVGVRASRQVTDEVFRRDGYRCRLCGSTVRLTVEYAISPENGGNSRNPSDLRTVCASCITKPVKEESNKNGKGILRRFLGR